MIHEITVHELAKRLADDESILLLDVREPDEHAIASLPGSTLMPMGELAQRWNELTANPEMEIVVYCHHGVRSRHAASYLQKCGLKSLHSLAGGIDAWSRLIDPKMPRY